MAHRVHAITFREVLTLKRHTVLHGNTAAQRFDAVNVLLGHGFCVVKEPVQAIERNIAVHALKHIEHAADGFVIGGVQAERPAMLHQMAHHAFQLIFHAWREVRARFKEIFKIRGREHQHFTRAVVTEEIGALTRCQHVGPFLEIFQLMAGALGKEVVGDADGHLLFGVQFAYHFIVFGVVLEAAARVDSAGEAQTV